jgi:hypothetical protein
MNIDQQLDKVERRRLAADDRALARAEAQEAGQPTPEQLEAILAFARSHGRYWKGELNDAWLSGADAREPNGHLLRQVRNQFGPLWLVNYRSKA